MKNYIGVILLLLVAGCSTMSSFQYPPARWLRDTDNAPIKMPKVKLDHKHAQTQFGQLSAQMEDLFAFAQDVAAMPSGWVLSGKMESINANNFDEVADSAWFTNRIGRTSVFENNFKTPPSLKGKWTVVEVNKAKSDEEFVIQDANKNYYVIKIDKDPDWLVSGGELLGALILSAAGYNVTENYVLEFDSRILDKDILSGGQYRALAVRIPQGDLLGWFEFQGKRKDDPNDRLPHEYRRELCGLRVFASLLNNKGISTKNNLDVYRDGYVTHYLSNLSGSLANMRSEFLSGATRSEGHTIDALFSFGFYNPYWTSSDVMPVQYKGVLSSEKFHPKKWRPNKQNLAFKYMSTRDAFWASKILQQFTDDDIQKIVTLSAYRDEKTSERVKSEILTRRNKIVSYWFQKVNPLDNFRLNNGLEFDDISVPSGERYRYRVKGAREMADGRWHETSTRSIPMPTDIKKPIVVQLQTLREPKKGIWSPSVDVYIENKTGPTILGIKRRTSAAQSKTGQRSWESSR